MIHYISAERLTIARVEEILTKGYKLALSDDAKARINKCREYLDKKMEDAGAVFLPCAGLAVNIPDSISIESCYTKSIFGVVAQIPEIYKDFNLDDIVERSQEEIKNSLRERLILSGSTFDDSDIDELYESRLILIEKAIFTLQFRRNAPRFLYIFNN